MGNKIYIGIGSICLCLILSACSQNDTANIPSSHVAKVDIDLSKVEVVKQSHLQKYWTQTNRQFSLKRHENTEHASKGWVEIGFLIDENGQASHYEVLQSMPTGVWDEHGMNAAQQLRFKATDASVKVPVIYTTWVFEFNPHSP